MRDSENIRRNLPPGTVISTWTASDGWPLRRLDTPGTGRGRILFQTGRGDFFEKYLETFIWLNSAGWSVTSFDWRGQGGSGRLRDRDQAEDFARLVDDLAEFFDAWHSRSNSPHVVLGHSMGGHLALRALAEGRIDPDALVLVAPMLGLASPIGQTLGGAAARFMAGLGDPGRPAWHEGERPGASSRQAVLTSDPERYADEIWWRTRQSELVRGPPSWGWLAEAFASTIRLARDPRLTALRTPVLLLVAKADRLVDPRLAIRLIRRLVNAEIIRFGPDSAHEILRERDDVRDRALGAIIAFLDRLVAR